MIVMPPTSDCAPSRNRIGEHPDVVEMVFHDVSEHRVWLRVSRNDIAAVCHQIPVGLRVVSRSMQVVAIQQLHVSSADICRCSFWCDHRRLLL